MPITSIAVFIYIYIYINQTWHSISFGAEVHWAIVGRIGEGDWKTR